jgi:hypothetical protein
MQPVLFQYLNLRKKRDGFVPGPTPAECATGPPNWRSSRCWCERHARPKRFRAKPVPDLIRDGYRFAVGKRFKTRIESPGPIPSDRQRLKPEREITNANASLSSSWDHPMHRAGNADVCPDQGETATPENRRRRRKCQTGTHHNEFVPKGPISTRIWRNHCTYNF